MAQTVELSKSPTGIQSLDEILQGGFPSERATLILGTAGAGKTLLSVWFLVNGIEQFSEPGVLVSFDETPDQIASNFLSFGYDLADYRNSGRLGVLHVPPDTSMQVTGEYDLDGLIVRILHAAESIGACRVVLDSIGALEDIFEDRRTFRSGLHTLFRRLKEQGLTTVVTSELSEGRLSERTLQEYVADCVLHLSQEMVGRLANRQLRVAKYRGSGHDANEYPFLIHDGGLHLYPYTSLIHVYPETTERVSSGVPDLDDMLGGPGFLKGTSVLVSGSAGTGKTSLCASVAMAAHEAGGRCLYFTFEESDVQIRRNVASIGVDLSDAVAAGTVKIHASRFGKQSLESHLLEMQRVVSDFDPDVTIVDPVSGFLDLGDIRDVRSMLMRMADFLRRKGITAVFTELLHNPAGYATTETYISSIMDAWIVLRNVEHWGERNRLIQIFKARGIAHSNQVREFHLTEDGIHLRDVYVGPDGVATGANRTAAEATARAERESLEREAGRAREQLALRKKTLDGEMDSLKANYDAEVLEIEERIAELEVRQQVAALKRDTMAQHRRQGRGGTE